MTSAFEFDQDNMKLDIKEKKPLKIKEEKESPQESYIEPLRKQIYHTISYRHYHCCQQDQRIMFLRKRVQQTRTLQD